jgi:hypothetical protein
MLFRNKESHRHNILKDKISSTLQNKGRNDYNGKIRIRNFSVKKITNTVHKAPKIIRFIESSRISNGDMELLEELATGKSQTGEYQKF